MFVPASDIGALSYRENITPPGVEYRPLELEA